jgi:hypothetical protein
MRVVIPVRFDTGTSSSSRRAAVFQAPMKSPVPWRWRAAGPRSVDSGFGAPAGKLVWIPAGRRRPAGAVSRIDVAETAKASLDMTAAAVEAAPHASPDQGVRRGARGAFC